MKKNYISLILTTSLYAFNISAQNIGINGSGANAHPSALLDIDASSTPSLGLLVPRIPLQAVNIAAPVNAPATSLFLYNTATAGTGTNAVSPGYYYWDGTQWQRFAYNPNGNNANAWNLLGNSGTTSSTNFLGTTDNQDLAIKVNSTERMRIYNTSGYVRIGAAGTPGALLQTFDATAVDDIIMSKFHNTPTVGPSLRFRRARGTQGSPTVTQNGDFIGMLTFEGYGNISLPGAAIKGVAAENFASNTNSGSDMAFYTTLIGSATNAEKMRLTNAGYIGLGTINPSSMIDINGTITGGIRYLKNAPDARITLGDNIKSWSWATGWATGGDFSLIEEGTAGNRLYVQKTTGNVGVGTSNPVSKLEVDGGITALGNSQWSNVDCRIYGSGGPHPAFVGLYGRGTNLSASYPLAGDALVGFIGRDAIDGYASTNYGGAAIYMVAAQNYSAINKGTFMVFSTTSNNSNAPATERMRITDIGSVGIGTSIPAQMLDVAGNAIFNGTFYASDMRYKTNIQPLANALYKLENLRGVSYNYNPKYKTKRGFDNNKQLGVIAQEIETFFPEIVTTDTEGYKAVDYAKLAPVFIEAIKELSKRNNELLKRLEVLEDRYKIKH